jgi:hypothetical protein
LSQEQLKSKKKGRKEKGKQEGNEENERRKRNIELIRDEDKLRKKYCELK